MLRVFSNQLRQIHKKTESILNKVQEDQQVGMLAVAKSLYDAELYRSACDVYIKFLSRYPTTPKKMKLQNCTLNVKCVRNEQRCLANLENLLWKKMLNLH